MKGGQLDNLITFKEYINAIKAIPNLRILPRTLSFREVLHTLKYETTFTVSDNKLDDIAMLRYELNSISNLHMFQDEHDSNLYMGAHPLSKNRDGRNIRDLDENMKQWLIEKYRPPGVFRVDMEKQSKYCHEMNRLFEAKRRPMDKVRNSNVPVTYEYGEKTGQEELERVERHIWNAVPSKQLYTRQHERCILEIQAHEAKLIRINQMLNEEQKVVDKENNNAEAEKLQPFYKTEVPQKEKEKEMSAAKKAQLSEEEELKKYIEMLK